MADGEAFACAAVAAPSGSADPTRRVAPDAYRAFLEDKVEIAPAGGIDVPIGDLNPWLKPHAKVAVRWMLLGGRRACFASFGLAKTSIQLEAVWQVLLHLGRQPLGVVELDHASPSVPSPAARATSPMKGEEGVGAARVGGRGLIVIPLGVKHDFARDAAAMGVPVRFVRSTFECWGPGLYITHYEAFRDGKVDLSGFDVVSLDEAACLRGMGGTKTFRTAANELTGVPFRFVATATPSPNDFIEMLAYAEVLGIMDIGQAKTRFFKRNSEKADELTLHPHRERAFWMWVASWALFITRPSDVGCDDTGYDLPELDVRWHCVPTPPPFDEDDAHAVRSGQQLEMFRSDRIGVVDHAREKRRSLFARVAKMAEIVACDPDDHYVLWHDLNAERDLIAHPRRRAAA
ncbi:hypothetical protein [Phenylobacterium sp.]|uniref:hypothetical protein n=1 Tax=Phenylobacterium sp. TaxID=1871053 RepID=UPI0025CC7F19|nr:hypothetical protein [Phenylobacterium sp.]MBX3482525.1 hypothetical protein [Phenylobacterium sp.]